VSEQSLRETGVVGGVAVPHAPQFFTLPATEDHEQVERIRNTMGEMGKRLLDLKPDAIVIIANDHLDNFLLGVSPAFTIHRGPKASGKFNDTEFEWPVHSDAALDLAMDLQEQGFDPALSLNAPIGYEFGIPLTFMGITDQVPIIPIFINSYVPPQPSPDRCYALGKAIDNAAKRLGLRLAVVASGGLSHYPGTELYSNPDVKTDTYLLERMSQGNLRVLLSLDDRMLDHTGNVEARSWLMLAGALGERVPSQVALEPSWHHVYAMVSWDATSPERELPEVHYPIPRADQLPLYEALYDLRMNDDSCLAFINDPEEFASRWNLTPEEAEAVASLSEEKINGLGVHPLLGFLARLQVGLVKKRNGLAE
jgi:2,3-dihydroxyphenylpropionate 1,2-dioxygenase